MTIDGARVIPLSRSCVPQGDANLPYMLVRVVLMSRYALKQWPFTLNFLLDMMSEMSTDCPSNNSRTMYGPSHHGRSFSGKSLRWEL